MQSSRLLFPKVASKYLTLEILSFAGTFSSHFELLTCLSRALRNFTVREYNLVCHILGDEVTLKFGMQGRLNNCLSPLVFFGARMNLSISSSSQVQGALSLKRTIKGFRHLQRVTVEKLSWVETYLLVQALNPRILSICGQLNDSQSCKPIHVPVLELKECSLEIALKHFIPVEKLVLHLKMPIYSEILSKALLEAGSLPPVEVSIEEVNMFALSKLKQLPINLLRVNAKEYTWKHDEAIPFSLRQTACHQISSLSDLGVATPRKCLDIIHKKNQVPMSTIPEDLYTKDLKLNLLLKKNEACRVLSDIFR